MKSKFKALSIAGTCAFLLAGCAVPTPPTVAQIPPPSAHTATPDLSAYVRFELYAQNAGPSDRPLGGSLKFQPEGARFDVFQMDGREMGRLHLQPDTCPLFSVLSVSRHRHLKMKSPRPWHKSQRSD